MTYPAIVKGQYWGISVSVDGSGTDGSFVYLCGLTTRNLTRQAQTSDNVYRDCNDPSQVPFRTTNVTSQQFDMSGSGTYNRAQGDILRNIFGLSLPYRFIQGEDASNPVDGGYWQGKFVLTNMQQAAADGADVTAQMTFQSDGEVLWNPGGAAEMIVLDALTLGTRAATHGNLWTSVINGRTVGSTITATSADGTTLTVSGSNVSGTYSAAGQPVITLVETLAAATNTPRSSRTTVNVA